MYIYLQGKLGVVSIASWPHYKLIKSCEIVTCLAPFPCQTFHLSMMAGIISNCHTYPGHTLIEMKLICSDRHDPQSRVWSDIAILGMILGIFG
jgi:hypothetical protein